MKLVSGKPVSRRNIKLGTSITRSSDLPLQGHMCTCGKVVSKIIVVGILVNEYLSVISIAGKVSLFYYHLSVCLCAFSIT